MLINLENLKLVIPNNKHPNRNLLKIFFIKVYVKRLKRAKGRRDIKAIGRIRKNKPTYKVDHIVKERYRFNPNSTSLINFYFEINNFSDIQHIQMQLETWMIVYHWCFYSLFCRNQEESMLSTFNCAENYLVITLFINLNILILSIIYFIHKNS